MFKNAVNALKKLHGKNEYYFAKTRYIKYYKKMPLNEHLILLESQHGSQYNGNVYYLLRELCNPEYDDYQVYLSIRASKANAARIFLDNHNLNSVKLVILSSDEYFQVLASSKYLINDNTFLPFFIKKEGQVYLNTWHGTPLKTLGNKSENFANTIGNTQRNFCLADYLLAPNEYTEQCLTKDYMLSNIAKTKVILEGYPRNEAFFDGESRNVVRRALDLNDKTIIAYMPTWRGYGGFEDVKAESYLLYYLSEMDKRLKKDEQIMYVNLHPIARSHIEFDCFDNIRPFPIEYETYEFLNACDCLITDYSSVMFDFALSRKKIILFTYDLDKYKEDRGLNIQIEKLGIPLTSSLDELFDVVNSNESGTNAYLQEFIRYDSPIASRNLCHLLLGISCDLPQGRIREVANNNKKNILIYSGDLARNGITSSLISTLHSVHRDKYNFVITLRQKFPKDNLGTLIDLSNFGIPYVLMLGRMNLTLFQKAVHYLYDQRLLPFVLYRLLMGDAYSLETQRLFGGMRVDSAIHFTGYEYRRIMQFSTFKCPRTIYVHNNMVEEIERKHNQRKGVLRWAYRNYDHVVLVTEDMHEPTRRIAKDDSKFQVIPNLFDYQSVLKKSNESFHFDKYTKSNHDFGSIAEMLQEDCQVVISIGRFSPEKGHRRLIQSFATVAEHYPGAKLIILGGRSFDDGECSFSGLCAYVEEIGMNNSIVLIQNMSNPYPLLKQCDGLILPSLHEGFGLVLLEADILGVPVVATDIPGPSGFMKDNGGKLVANTDQGVREGLEYLLSGMGHPLGIDYSKYNQAAIRQFEELLDLN